MEKDASGRSIATRRTLRWSMGARHSRSSAAGGVAAFQRRTFGDSRIRVDWTDTASTARTNIDPTDLAQIKRGRPRRRSILHRVHLQAKHARTPWISRIACHTSNLLVYFARLAPSLLHVPQRLVGRALTRNSRPPNPRASPPISGSLPMPARIYQSPAVTAAPTLPARFNVATCSGPLRV